MTMLSNPTEYDRLANPRLVSSTHHLSGTSAAMPVALDEGLYVKAGSLDNQVPVAVNGFIFSVPTLPEPKSAAGTKETQKLLKALDKFESEPTEAHQEKLYQKVKNYIAFLNKDPETANDPIKKFNAIDQLRILLCRMIDNLSMSELLRGEWMNKLAELVAAAYKNQANAQIEGGSHNLSGAVGTGIATVLIGGVGIHKTMQGSKKQLQSVHYEKEALHSERKLNGKLKVFEDGSVEITKKGLLDKKQDVVTKLNENGRKRSYEQERDRVNQEYQERLDDVGIDIIISQQEKAQYAQNANDIRSRALGEGRILTPLEEQAIEVNRQDFRESNAQIRRLEQSKGEIRLQKNQELQAVDQDHRETVELIAKEERYSTKTISETEKKRGNDIHAKLLSAEGSRDTAWGYFMQNMLQLAGLFREGFGVAKSKDDAKLSMSQGEAKTIDEQYSAVSQARAGDTSNIRSRLETMSAAGNSFNQTLRGA